MINVTHEAGDRLRISVRGHEFFTDQPQVDGGADSAPTPTELFVAGLAACVGFYAERYLRRHGLSTTGLKITSDYRWAENPHRVGEIALRIEAPGLTADRLAAFERVVGHCTVHTTLEHPPSIRMEMAQATVTTAA